MKDSNIVQGFPALIRAKQQSQGFYILLAMTLLDELMNGSGAADNPSPEFSQEAQKYAANRLSEYGTLRILESAGDMVSWRIDIPADSALLYYDSRIWVNDTELERLADDLLHELRTPVQVLVSSVYESEADMLQAQNELSMLMDHVLFQGVTDSVCGRFYHGTSSQQQYTQAVSLKMSMEKQFFNAVMSLNFSHACELFLTILDLEMKVPETAVSVKPRVVNRLAWIIYVLGSPKRKKGPLERNTMAAIAALAASDSMEALRKGIQDVFQQFDHDYNVQEPSSKLTQIKSYIHEHYHDCNLDASQICSQFGISPSYLSQLFRKETGNTMLDYIYSLRIQAVKDLLLHTELPLQEISQRCGYFSTWTMIRTFKKYEGITPGEYRKQAL